MNKDKTKFQIWNPDPSDTCDPIIVAGEPVRRVRAFVYLGSVFNEACEEEEDIERRLDLANKAWRRFSKVMSCRHITRRLKFRVFRCFIEPVAIYGCETWRMNAAQKQRLDVWYRARIRHIYGASRFDHIRNEELYNYFNTHDFSDIIRKRRLDCAGHILRNIPMKDGQSIFSLRISKGKPLINVSNPGIAILNTTLDFANLIFWT